MMAFANSRLARPQPPPTTTTPTVTKNAQSSSRTPPTSSNSRTAAAASTSSTIGKKRPRSHTRDALFAGSDEEDEDVDEDADDHPMIAAASSKHAIVKSLPPPNTHASRANNFKQSPSQQRSQHKYRDEEDEDEEDDENDRHSSKAADPNRPKKKSRSAPEELKISRRPVASNVIITALPSFNIEKKRRDPRFDPLCGDYDPSHFHAHYTWMNEEKMKEVEEWKQELASGRRNKQPLTDEEREELRDKINRTKQAIAASKRTQGETSLVKEWKHNERLAQKEGKKPFYLKKSEQKKLALAARYLEMKNKKGALQKFMEKKTKQIKNKDHVYMPREGSEE